MADVLLFHHAQGLTAGCRRLADVLRAAGHDVHTPDLYERREFAQLADGMAYLREIGFGTILERGRAAAEGLPAELVYLGLSLGAMPAQLLAQTRRGARGAVLLHAAVPPSELGGSWPAGVPLQIHVMEDDELGDVEVARALVAEIETAELFLYPGDRHLFSDSSLPDYDPSAARLLEGRLLAFLAGLDQASSSGGSSRQDASQNASS
ncbi:MAG TPA: dienelactone hydrolase family protein [Gaiellaceae bacterium]|nr:dienelactone hydrolase family protein [Gaiellaceae bacterium]